MKYEEGSLEELWSIKRAIASQYATLKDYFQGMMDYQASLARDGVMFYSFPSKPAAMQTA